MEHIRQAVELAHARGAARNERAAFARAASPQLSPSYPPEGASRAEEQSILLNPAHLESMRIIAHDVMDYRSKPFDMLRTQIVRQMNEKNWRTIAVTSPTAGCGKTVTAINLALSIARQPNNSVFIVDMDLQRPRVATSLGINCTNGLISVLEGRSSLSDAVIQAQIRNYRIKVLPCEASTSYSSEWMASPQVSDILQGMKSDVESHISIVDLPPILTSDDVISVLPQIDCVLLVAAVGVSTLSDVEQCKRHLQSSDVVRVVLNKTVEKSHGYYY